MIRVQPGDPPVLVVAGQVNYESAPSISEAFGRLRQEGLLDLALDCQAVDFIDSSGIGVIVHAAQVLRNAGGRLRLRAATRQFVHALQVSGFAQLLDWETFVPTEAPSAGETELGPQTWQRASFSMPVQADTDGAIRKRVTELARTMPFTQDQIDDIRLAVGEAVSNAIRHGCPNKGSDRLTVHCIGDSEKLVIKVHNPGQPFDPDSVAEPDPSLLREGGMGVFFIRTSMDLVQYEFDDTGTTVTMAKYIPGGKTGSRQ